MTVNTDKTSGSNIWNIVNSSYEEPEAFQIELFNSDFSIMKIEKITSLIQWLCHENYYLPFQIPDNRFLSIYYNVIFYNPTYISVGGIIYGLRLQCKRDSIYGYGEEKSLSFTSTYSNRTFTIVNNSDEQKCLYPHLTITIPSSATSNSLTIINSCEQNHRVVAFENLFPGEILTLDNENKLIASTYQNKIPLSYFNKHWFRLLNGKNIFTTNMDCTLDIKYSERFIRGIIT